MCRLVSMTAFWIAGLAAIATAGAEDSGRTKARPFWDGVRQGHFVTSLCADHDGRLWVGTEGEGVWQFDPAPRDPMKAWTHFTRESTGGEPEKSGPVLTAGTANERALGDDYAYALACDTRGRIWVGHVNHGVSVFNGKEWRNYDAVNGPLGERVFDIAVCPTDEDVWIATNAGLARYSTGQDAWTYYTREDGLVSDQVQSLAFDKRGNLYAGTQCDGLMRAGRAEDGQYTDWRNIRGAETMPNTPVGRGLPTNLINDVLVARDGTVYVATTTGLARSRDDGKTWDFTRGKNWEQKVTGLYHGPKAVATAGEDTVWLKEDYVTCVQEDDNGRIWVGFWTQGWLVLDPKAAHEPVSTVRRSSVAVKSPWRPRVVASSRKPGKAGQFVSALLPRYQGVASYGLGLECQDLALPSNEETQNGGDSLGTDTRSRGFPPLPSTAKPPTPDAIRAMQFARGITRPSEGQSGAKAVYSGEDWTTQGDWFGRYGRKHTVLCAANAPWDEEVSYGLAEYKLTSMIGPNHEKEDMLRNWCWAIKSDERRVLYDPCIALRRPSGWDDHGEGYPATQEGPDLWLFADIRQKGWYAADLYFVNYDGHRDRNRFRDYSIEVHEVHGNPLESPVLASARVRDWWSGVYKQFAIKGPGKFGFRIARNGSHNVMIMGVMIDKIGGDSDVADSMELVWAGNLPYGSPKCLSSLLPPNLPFELGCLDRNRESWYRWGVLAYRSIRSVQGMDSLRKWLRWRLHLWTIDDRKEFDATMVDAWKRTQDINPELKSRKWRKYSPGTQ